MGDFIKGTPGHLDDVAGAMLNQETLRDNHNNTYRNSYLSCAGGKPINLENDGPLLDALDAQQLSILNLFSPPGDIYMHFGEESPLQTVCRQIEAKAHHTERASSPSRMR